MNWLDKRRNQRIGELQLRADALRDARAWQDAAVIYTEYLGHRATDFAIWVQLGHVQKESGDLDGSLASYSRAEALRDDDSDLLLSLGHLHKLRGDVTRAHDYYIASMQAGDAGFAAGEAQRLRDEYPQAGLTLPATRSNPDQTVPPAILPIIKQLSGITEGADVVNVSGLETTELGALQGINADPWILLRPCGIPAEVRLAELEITLVVDPNEAPFDGRLYIDYGHGLDELRAIKVSGNARPITVLLAMPGLIQHLRWDPDTAPSRFSVSSISLRPLLEDSDIMSALDSFAVTDMERDVAALTIGKLQDLPLTHVDAAMMQKQMPPLFDIGHHYDYWLKRYVTPDEDGYRRIAEMTTRMAIRPSFSFVMPTYNTPPALLKECLDSMLAQTYPDFEICVADDASPDPEVAAILGEYARAYDNVRIALRQTNGHISAASNSALALASGDFVVLVDHDDLIPDYALTVVAAYINRHPNADILYSDEDKIDVDGLRHSPYFKGEFNKFLMFGHNMVSHLGIYRRALVEQVGGFRLGLEGSQDYDLFLRCYERIDETRIVHIPHVLYHWRAIPGSTAVSHDQKSYAIIAAESAITGYFERNAVPLRSTNGFAPGLTGLRPTREYDTSITIIIPTRDGLDVLAPCIESIKALHPDNVEILIIDNGSSEPATLNYFERLQRVHKSVRVIAYHSPFNFSEINNFGAEHARGEILCFLNNDTEVVSRGWLARARMLLAMPDVGMVGARLLYPDGILQHFGIGLGMADHKVAGTPHAGIAGPHGGYFGKARLIQDVSAVTAACMFMRAEDFRMVGRFDPQLRVAYNDVDLCLRVRQAGLRIVCDPDIELIHKESRSRGADTTPEKRARLDEEAALMRDRWAAVLDADPFLSPNHDLTRPDFALAYPPRTVMPWLEASH